MNTAHGTVTLEHSTVQGNKAHDKGGGIQNGSEGSLTLEDSTVSGNTAAFGGGIVNEGTLKLSNSTVKANAVTQVEEFPVGLVGGDGGGIYNEDSVTLAGSASVVQNTASMHGGGIYNTEGATLVFKAGWHGTISGNTPDDIFNA